MSILNSDLILLEDLSKRISDLIYNNNFSQVSEIDAQRRALIKKIKDSEIHKKNIRSRIGKIVKNNAELLLETEKKLKELSKNHHSFNKRLKAYSINK